MEADWEVEIGGDAPVIDACWEGFVDLRRAPERAGAVAGSAELPALAMLYASQCRILAGLDIEMRRLATGQF